ncbi:MAG: hypothetical protein QM715_17180 [Nibricoccus sp.]
MSEHEASRPDKELKLGAKNFDCVNRPSGEANPDPSPDVHSILRENLRQEMQHEQPLDLTKPNSRRKRDYWTVLILGNALIAGVLAVLPKNPVVLLFGLSGLVMFTISITWVMWFVMSDY